MATFYRKSKDDKTVYKDQQYTQGIKDEAELRSLGGIPDWGVDASKTNIITGEPIKETPVETPIETPTEISTEVLDTPITTEDIQAQVSSPVEDIQQVFGQEWQPAPVFEQLGLTEQGIYGAVRTPNSPTVYLIGEGGKPIKDPEEYRDMFGTLSQEGIVGDVSVEQAKKLGINIEPDALLSDVLEGDIFPQGFGIDMTPEEKAQIGSDILAGAEIKYGVSDLRETKNKATQALIDSISGMWEKFTETKKEKGEELKLEEKSLAISNAQKSYTDVNTTYEKYINDLTHSTLTTAHISGLSARARSQQAIELSGLASMVQTAEGNYDRAIDVLNQFSNDWQQAQEFSLQASQLQIDLLGENLSEAQERSRFEAQNKLDFFKEDYQRKLEDRDQIISLMAAFPEAGIRLDSTLQSAFDSIMPYVASDKEIEDRMKMIGLESAEIGLLIDKKNLAKPYWQPTAPVEEIPDLTSPTPPDWFREQANEIMQMTIMPEKLQTEWDAYKGAMTPEQIAGEYFNDTQIAKGASIAGMSIEEFRKLSIDEANNWINMPKAESAEDEMWARLGL